MKNLLKTLLTMIGIIIVCCMCLFVAACNNDRSKKTEVDYSISVYLSDGSQYLLSEEYSSTGKGNVGESKTVTAPEISGYTFNSAHSGNVTTLTLSKTASENVFKLYYDKDSVRETFNVRYNANAPTGSTVVGSMERDVTDEDGTITVAECGFSIEGYRFAGWNDSQSGANNGIVKFNAGQSLSVSATTTLYAVWDKAYKDRFGGTDEIFVPSGESGKAIMRRGGIEFEAKLDGDVFTFEKPGNTSIQRGKIYDDYSFAYAQEDLAGTYSYRNSYFNPDDPEGKNAVNSEEKLVLDEFGEGEHIYKDLSGKTVSDFGFASQFSYGENPEYLFLVTGKDNAGNGFVFRKDRTGSEFTFSPTQGEAGVYTMATTADNYAFTPTYFAMELDGYGGLIFAYNDGYNSAEWTGIYWIENVYVRNSGLDYAYFYKIHMTVEEDAYNNLEYLGYEVVDGKVDIDCYTSPVNETTNVFMEPYEERGEYHSADGGATLQLDGFKLFYDSAVYTVGGETIQGSYQTVWTQDDELTIEITVFDIESGLTTGDVIKLKIDTKSNQEGFEILDTFSVLNESEDSEFISYVIFDENGFGNEVIYMSQEYVYDMGGYPAKYGVVNNGEVQILAEGVINEFALDVEGLFEFTRTSLKNNADDIKVPESMIMEFGTAYDSIYFLYNIYYVLSAQYGDNEVKEYIEITDANSNDKIWYIGYESVGVSVAVFFDNGVGYLGSFSMTEDNFGPFGTLMYLGRYDVVYTMYLDLELDVNGNPATYIEIPEAQYPLMSVDLMGTFGDDMVHFIIRGEEALYSASGDWDMATHGRVEVVDKNFMGEDIWAFINDNDVEQFRFVKEYTVYYDELYGAMDIVAYHLYYSEYDNTYTSDVGKLELDGCYWGRFTDPDGKTYSGSYTMSSDKKIVYLNFTTGTLCFDISDELYLTDGIYGEYAIYADGHWWDLYFDGHGNVTANSRMGTNEFGLYIFVEENVVDLFINLEEGVNSYRIKLSMYDGHGEVQVYDKNLENVYVGEDWSVMYLDGYGDGTYYFYDGSGSTPIYFTMLDEEVGFISIRTPSFLTQNLILDYENKTYSFPEYVNESYIYYGEDLSALIFSPDGEIMMNYTAGFYFIGENVSRAYLQDEFGDFYSVDLGGMPGNETYVIGGKKYYLYKQGGQKVKLNGTVEIEYDGSKESRQATLEFTLNGKELVESAGTFTVGNDSYSVRLVNLFYDYAENKYKGLAIKEQYEYTPFSEYKYTGNGSGTFKVVVKPEERTSVEGFELEDGIGDSTITEYKVGFGPFSMESKKLSGHVYIGDGKYLTFENAVIETVYYFDVTLGYRYNVVFKVDNTTYSLQYNKEDDGMFRLYMIGTYELKNCGEYSVGIIKYFYSNDAWDLYYDEGEIADIIVYKGTGEDKKPIIAFNKMVNEGSTSAWYIDLGSYDPDSERGELGSIYLIDLKDNLSVKEYDLVQAAQSNLYFANLYLENGEVKGVAALNMGGEFGSIVSSEEIRDNEWRVICSDGTQWLITLAVDDQGKPVYNSDGTWKMTLKEYNKQ